MNECASSLFHLFILFCFVHSNSALYFADLGKTSLSPYSPQSIAYGSLKHMRLFITCESPKPSPRYPWIPEQINSGSLCLWTCYYLLCSAQLWSKHETHFLIDFHKNPFRIWAKHHLSHGTANNFLFISQLPISSGFFVTPMSQHFSAASSVSKTPVSHLILLLPSLLLFPSFYIVSKFYHLTAEKQLVPQFLSPNLLSADQQTKEVHFKEFTLLRRQL